MQRGGILALFSQTQRNRNLQPPGLECEAGSSVGAAPASSCQKWRIEKMSDDKSLQDENVGSGGAAETFQQDEARCASVIEWKAQKLPVQLTVAAESPLEFMPRQMPIHVIQKRLKPWRRSHKPRAGAKRAGQNRIAYTARAGHDECVPPSSANDGLQFLPHDHHPLLTASSALVAMPNPRYCQPIASVGSGTFCGSCLR